MSHYLGLTFDVQGEKVTLRLPEIIHCRATVIPNKLSLYSLKKSGKIEIIVILIKPGQRGYCRILLFQQFCPGGGADPRDDQDKNFKLEYHQDGQSGLTLCLHRTFLYSGLAFTLRKILFCIFSFYSKLLTFKKASYISCSDLIQRDLDGFLILSHVKKFQVLRLFSSDKE